jgi:hypothetical protein
MAAAFSNSKDIQSYLEAESLSRMAIASCTVVMNCTGKTGLHRDGAQGYAYHLLDGNEDKGEPRPPDALKLSKKKHHAAFVLS